MAGEESDLETVLSAVQESCRWKLDQQIDFEHDDGRGRVVPKHIGKIAGIMTGWEETIACELGLTESELHDILAKNTNKPTLQRREALNKWKGRLGRRATYRALIEVFVGAGHSDHADVVCRLLNVGSASKPTGGSPTGASGGGGVQNGSSMSPTTTPERQASTQSGGAESSPSSSWSGPSGSWVGSSLTFSREMGPSKLCEWLLRKCGHDYSEDIDKVKAGGINGELFLDLPEDDTLLQDLKLSPGFKKLLVKRAKQQVEVQLRVPIDLNQSMSSSASESSLLLQSLGPESLIEAGYGRRVGPFNPTATTLSEESVVLPVGPCHSTMTTMNEASLPEESLELPGIPVCTTVDSDDEKQEKMTGDAEDCGGGELDPDSLSAWVHKNVIWRGRKELGVKFLNDIPDDWMYEKRQLNIGNIMSWAKEWSLRAKGIIPMFTRIEDPNAVSDIRVMFTSGKTRSKIGLKAKRVSKDKPTMWLNLHSGGIDDGFKKHLVVHEFGHALGLGHEHQRSDFWELLKPYLNEAAMKQRLGVDGDDFKHDWGRCKKFVEEKATPYDSDSVMHYWFLKEWLVPPYHIRKKIVEDSKPGGPLSREVAKVLLGVHDRDARDNPPPESPSNKDIDLLKEQYGSSDTCTLMGPDPPPTGKSAGTHTQDPKEVSYFTLSNLKNKAGEKISIINKVAPCWSKFAAQLDFDREGSYIQTIEKKCHWDPEACCEEMMRQWLKGKGNRQPVTWKLLVEILHDTDLNVLADQVEEVTCVQE